MNDLPDDGLHDPNPAVTDPGIDELLEVDELLDDEALDRELAASDQLLSTQLRELLDPDEALGRRTAVDVGRALRSRSTMAAALDLLGTGWWTARALLTDDPGRADEEPEGI